jgi:hypothetical protein
MPGPDRAPEAGLARYVSTMFHFETERYQGDRQGRPYNICQMLCAQNLIHGVTAAPRFARPSIMKFTDQDGNVLSP